MKSRKIPNGYYVYAYINKKTKLPYYIGKGFGKRMYDSHSKHGITTPRDIHYITILEESLSEIGALALERRYIQWYGRKDNNTGILHNKTDGGESTLGHIKSPDQIEKHRNKIKGRLCWTNGIKTVRSVLCPGNGWVRGNSQIGKKWWTNGIDEIWDRQCPSGWIKGRIPKMKQHLKDIASDAGIKGSSVRWGNC